MKTRITLLLVVAINLFQSNIFVAQNGTNCSNAVQLSPSNICNYTNYTSTTSEMWFKFTATAENIHVSILTEKYGIDLPHIHNLKIFEGICSNNVMRENKDLPFTDSADVISLDLVSYGLVGRHSILYSGK